MKLILIISAFVMTVSSALAQQTTKSSALAEFSTPKYGAGFTHFDYANPEAPKGGAIVLAEPGSFDSLNPIPLRGEKPRSLGLERDALFTASADELDVAYGLIAESVEYPEDKSWAIFHLRPEARWHDGQPITARDFVFAWNAIQEHGNPFLRSFLEPVATVEALGDRQLKVTFKTRGEIKPLIQFATTLSPEPEHWWSQEGRAIGESTLQPPLASGPYRIAAVDPGRSVTYERVPDYWGKDLPVNAGHHNFDRIRYDFYRDDDVMFEAFKAGAYDLHEERKAQRWVTGYDLPAVRRGELQKRTLPNERPLGAQGIRFNTRRDTFADPRVRLALSHLFDFEWIRKNILYGQYERVKSNFPNSDFGASGTPGAAELALLEPYRDQLPQEVFDEPYEPPASDGSGNDRRNLRKALALFREAGWELKDGRLVDAKTGEPMRIEFLEDSQTMVRVLQPYVTALQRAGIDAAVRVVDTAQYQKRTDDFDFDAVTVFFNFFPPPGTELRSYFGSAAANEKGSANYAGIQSPVVDALIEKVLTARDLESMKTASRALDRVLLWGHYMVPQWYNDEVWLAHWNKFAWPEQKPKYDTGFPSTWWFDEDKMARGTAQ